MKQIIFIIIFVWLSFPTTIFSAESADDFLNDLLPNAENRRSKKPENPVSRGVLTTKPLEKESNKTPSSTMRLQFERNSDRLTDTAKATLDQLGKALKDERLKDYIFIIEGYTCNLGGDEYNLDLSRRRAFSVKNYLVDKFNIQDIQFQVRGYGKANPVASNATEAGREQNRRVVIVNTLEKTGGNLSVQTQDVSEFGTPSSHEKVLVKIKKNTGEKVREGDILTQNDGYFIEFKSVPGLYVYIYQRDGSGEIVKLFPNPAFSKTGNPSQDGKIYRIPDNPKWIYLDENKGKEEVFVLANEKPLTEEDCRREMNTISERGVEPRPKEKNIYLWKQYFIHK